MQPGVLTVLLPVTDGLGQHSRVHIQAESLENENI